MQRTENDCVDCGKPRLGDACRYRNVVHFYCDRCESEVDKLYVRDGEELCHECLVKQAESECEKIIGG